MRELRFALALVVALCVWTTGRTASADPAEAAPAGPVLGNFLSFFGTSLCYGAPGTQHCDLNVEGPGAVDHSTTVRVLGEQVCIGETATGCRIQFVGARTPRAREELLPERWLVGFLR